METKQIKIKYLVPGLPRLHKTVNGDWIDLYTAEDTLVDTGEFKLIPLGVAIELPKGYEALIIPRSSTFKKFGLLQTNSVGLIDESYKGDNDEWMMPVFATHEIYIPKHTRICQFRIFKHQPTIMFKEVQKLNNPDRNGFGSTGN